LKKLREWRSNLILKISLNPSLDASDVPQHLESIKARINQTLEMGSGGQMMTDPSLAYQPINYAPLPPMSLPGPDKPLMDWLENTSRSMQMGYHKSTEIAENVRLGAETAGLSMKNYFNQGFTPPQEMSFEQLAGNALGIGYDPLSTTMTLGQYEQSAKKSLGASLSLGMSDKSILDFAASGAELGLAASVIPGIGMIAGTGVGFAAGALYGVANEAVKPFATESIERMRHSRGLQQYSQYATSGMLGPADTEKVASYMMDRDRSDTFTGMGIDRDDTKQMYDQLTSTSYFQQSTDSDDMIEKIKGFTADFAKVMHVMKVGKEEVGKVVDMMNDSGLLDQHGGNIGDAASQISGLSRAARLNTEQGTQLFNLGSEMMRGTGITMASGGESLLNIRADIINAVKEGTMSNETIRQMGGTDNAAATMMRFETNALSSPEGLLYSIGAGNGGGAGLGNNYMAGLGSIKNYNDYLNKSEEAFKNISDPSFRRERAIL